MNRKTFQAIGFWVIFWFVLLFISSLQFDYAVLPNVGKITAPMFVAIGGWLGLTYAPEYGIVSDSWEMYLQTLLLIPFSIIMAMFSSWLERDRKHHLRIRYWFRVGISYYLALQLFKYGFDKLFKHQFYLPEPNTLFTPLGHLSRDILYWSTIGSSYSYNVFMGLLEIIPATLLLFKRTRLIGALITIAVMINVCMVNIGFDISVKLYSAFLLFLGLILVSPNIKRLYLVLVSNQGVKPLSRQQYFGSRKQVFVFAIAKSLVVGLILFESLFSFFSTNNFNDDTAARPLLHGAYDVRMVKRNGDTLALLVNQAALLKRIFIHRSGYLITQTMNDDMQDYKLLHDLEHKQLTLSEYDGSTVVLGYRYSKADSLLKLSGIMDADTIEIIARQVDLKKLPLLQEHFNWTVQGYIEAMNHAK